MRILKGIPPLEQPSTDSVYGFGWGFGAYGWAFGYSGYGFQFGLGDGSGWGEETNNAYLER